MAVIFKDIPTQNFRFASGLVFGWLVKDPTTQTEVRYAQYKDGRVFRSQPVKMWTTEAMEFSTKGREWTKVETVPEDAEFIGNYPPPVGRATW